jgi:cardiolipin synthase
VLVVGMGLPELLVVLSVGALALLAAGHALLSKRDSRAALGWIAVCLTFPLVGSVIYFVFGVNRIATRAKRLGSRWSETLEAVDPGHSDVGRLAPEAPEVPTDLAELVRISDAVTHRPLVGGNLVEPLHCGEEAYPAMLAAIEEATETIYLSTYIFDTDQTGRRFAYALKNARQRGVEVRVLVDGVGELYSWPRASKVLRELEVPVARFLPPRILPPAFHVNLRNHHKILTVDGRAGFTGGMNLGDRHMVSEGRRVAIDMHFRLNGPIVAQLEEVFRQDWWFVTNEHLDPCAWIQPGPGGALCRTVVDGPNEDLDKLLMILVGAISAARHQVQIMTPYFLPPRELMAALEAAALRGVEVRIVLPEKSNLPYVHWASRNQLWELLRRDVKVYYQPPPFVHTKLMMVDGHYAQVGSANLDPRSLRLNFEIAVEVLDPGFVEQVSEHFQHVRSRSRTVTLEEVETRSLPARARDALAWLFSPYL